MTKFTIQCPPNFENERMHWAVRSKAIISAREETLLAIRQVKALPTSNQRLIMAVNPQKRVVKFCRFFGGRLRRFDDGGLVSACKPVLDALKLIVGHRRTFGQMIEVHGAGLIFDDSAEWVTTIYEQVRDRTRAGFLVVEVS